MCNYVMNSVQPSIIKEMITKLQVQHKKTLSNLRNEFKDKIELLDSTEVGVGMTLP